MSELKLASTSRYKKIFVGENEHGAISWLREKDRASLGEAVLEVTVQRISSRQVMDSVYLAFAAKGGAASEKILEVAAKHNTTARQALEMYRNSKGEPTGMEGGDGEETDQQAVEDATAWLLTQRALVKPTIEELPAALGFASQEEMLSDPIGLAAIDAISSAAMSLFGVRFVGGGASDENVARTFPTALRGPA